VRHISDLSQKGSNPGQLQAPMPRAVDLPSSTTHPRRWPPPHPIAPPNPNSALLPLPPATVSVAGAGAGRVRVSEKNLSRVGPGSGLVALVRPNDASPFTIDSSLDRWTIFLYQNQSATCVSLSLGWLATRITGSKGAFSNMLLCRPFSRKKGAGDGHGRSSLCIHHCRSHRIDLRCTLPRNAKTQLVHRSSWLKPVPAIKAPAFLISLCLPSPRRKRDPKRQ
jgi:hypothetical protein